jgi:hypothetical protein
MKEQRITIEIDDKGSISVDAEGFSGGACLKDLERLLDGLAPGTATVARKPEATEGRVSVVRTQTAGKKP